MNLPIKLPLHLMQTKWKSLLDPVLSSPMSNVNILNGISLKSGSNVVNHLLGRTPQGWFLTDINAAATVYRSAPFNNLTLTLTASAPCTVNLGVF